MQVYIYNKNRKFFESFILYTQIGPTVLTSHERKHKKVNASDGQANIMKPDRFAIANVFDFAKEEGQQKIDGKGSKSLSECLHIVQYIT